MEEIRQLPKSIKFASWYGMLFYGILLLTGLLLFIMGIMGWWTVRYIKISPEELRIKWTYLVLWVLLLCLAAARVVASWKLLHGKKWTFWVCLGFAFWCGFGALTNLCKISPYYSLVLSQRTSTDADVFGIFLPRIIWSILGPVFVCECVTIAALLSEKSRLFFFSRQTTKK